MTKLNNKFEKRKRISKKEALELLKDCYEDIFKAYYNGLANYNEEVNMTIPEARTRLVGPLLNAKMTESFILAFCIAEIVTTQFVEITADTLALIGIRVNTHPGSFRFFFKHVGIASHALAGIGFDGVDFPRIVVEEVLLCNGVV